MEQQPNVQQARKPNPKPLIIVLMLVSFFGGSCTVQGMLGGTREVPDEQEVGRLLDEQGRFPQQMTPEARQEVVAAAHHFLAEQVRVAGNLRPFTLAFGVFLAAAYSFVILFGMRALAFVPGVARQLSFVSLAVLPARVAVAALDVAIARNLQPAMEAMAQTLASATQHGVPAAEAAQVTEAIGRAASWSLVGLQAGLAVVICALFTYAWRYFQRPEVLGLFDRKAKERYG